MSSARALLALPLLLGCAAGVDPVAHDDADLALYEGERVRLRSDLAPADAEAFVERLETLEVALDSAFPWLEAGPESPLSLIVADAARYTLRAEDHGVSAASGAFVCARGELTLRYRADEWQEGPPFPLEPRVRPLAAAALRRRLLRTYGEGLSPSWLEEGLVQVFVELAATALGETPRAAKLNRERLLDSFLPLFLGGRPALATLCNARGEIVMRRSGSRALAWAAVRFLLADAELTPLIAMGLQVAAGREGGEEAWDEAQPTLRAREGAFEAFLRDAVLEELLAAYQSAPTPVDRWESAAALRLIANIDIDADAGDPQRVLLARGARDLLAKNPVPARFLEKYTREFDLVLQSRSRLQAMSRLQKMVRRELLRRAQGYGHPAIERALEDLSRALGRALDERAQVRQ